MGCDYYIHTFLSVGLKDGTGKDLNLSTQSGYYGTYDDDNMTFEEYVKDIKTRYTTHKSIYKLDTWAIKNTQKYLDYLDDLDIKLEDVKSISKNSYVTERY